jgi:hypothetical protein
MALVFASTIGGISMAPAFGEENDTREGYQMQGRYEHGRHEHRRRVYQPRRRYYPETVYAPPPVVYAPAPYRSPGIRLFFPFHIR